MKVTLTINGQEFTATLEDNAATEALSTQLPMTITMDELNGNEKYCYLSESLPTSASNPGRIEAGDLMLYGDSCLVVFYKSFNTSYRYTRLGSIDDPSGLAQAVGRGSVTVTWGLGANDVTEG